MSPKISHAFEVILSVATSAFVWLFPFSIPNKAVVSVIFGVFAFGLFEYCIVENCRLVSTLVSRKIKIFGQLSLVLLYVLSLVIVFQPWNTSTSSFYLSWTDFDALNFARLTGSLLLTVFLPGYALVLMLQRFFNIGVSSKEGKAILSILMSIGITSLTAYLVLSLDAGFTNLQLILFLIYTAFLAVLVVSSFWKTRPSDQSATILNLDSKLLAKVLILVSVVAFLGWVFVSTHSGSQTLGISGDEFSHVGLTVQLLRGWQSWQSVQTKSGIYPYFLHLVFLSASVLSGIPVLNTFLAFSFLFALPVLAFYFMAKMLFDDERSTLSTAIFSLFAGFGWLYACFLQGNGTSTSDLSIISQASQGTYDVIRSSWLPIYVAPYIVDLSIFLVLVGLICSKRPNIKTVAFFTFLLTSLSVFIHIENVLILAFVLFVLSLFSSARLAKLMRYPKTVLSSFACGLILALGLNTVSLYNVSQDYFSMIEYALLACFCGLVLLVISDRSSLKILRLESFRRKLHSRSILACSMLGTYVVLAIASFFSFPTYVFSEPAVPIWFLPLKIGIVGLIVLGALFFSIPENGSIDLAVILAISVLVLQLLLYHLPISLTSANFSEFRIERDILWAFLSLMAAYGILKMLAYLKNGGLLKAATTRYAFASILIFVIIAGSIPSHLLKVEYYSSSQTVVSQEEMEALQFLSTLRIPSGSYILTGLSKTMVYAATGVPAIDVSDPVFSPLVFNSESAGTVLWTLNYLNVSYVYLSVEDVQYLNRTYGNSFFNWLLSHLSTIFKNDAAEIYQVPVFSPPMESSDTAVVTGDLLSGENSLIKDYVWIDNTLSINWTNTLASNVEHCNFTSDGDVASISAETLRNQQAAVFFVKNLEKPIPTNNGTTAEVKFRSATMTSFAIVDVIYSDGTAQRVTLKNNPYMNSLKWIISSESLCPNKSITSVRIGITDDTKANGDAISCSFDYIGIVQTDDPANYYSLPFFSSLMNIQFATVSESDDSLFAHKTLFISDRELNDAVLDQYVDWTRNGGSLVVTNTLGSGSFSRLAGITSSNSVIFVDSIMGDDGSSIKLNTMNVTTVQMNDKNLREIANFTFRNDTVSPFAIQHTLGKGQIVYVDLASIINNKQGWQDLARIAPWIGNLLKVNVPILLFNSSGYRRDFYVKNAGTILTEGETGIVTTDIVSGFSKLDGTTVAFSNKTGVPNFSTLEKVTIESLAYCSLQSIKITINGNVTFYPIDSNNYAEIAITGNSSFAFDLRSGDSLALNLKDNTVHTLQFSNGLLTIDAEQLQGKHLIVSNPTVENRGFSTFDSMFASYPYGIRSSGGAASLYGHLSFALVLSERQVMLLDDITFDGSLHVNQPLSSSSTTDFAFFLNYPLESLLFVLVAVLLISVVYSKIKKFESLPQ